MTSTHVWHVTIRDHEGNPVPDAEVALVDHAAAIAVGYPYAAVDANLPRVGSGEHESPEDELGLGPGAFALVVRAPGKSSVLQALDVKPIDGHLRPLLTFGNTVACVDVLGERIKVGDVVMLRSVFRVTLFPATEYVFIAGVRGPFLNFAKERARALEKSHKLDLPNGQRNLGAVFTIFSCAHGSKCRMVRAKRGWLESEPLPQDEIARDHPPSPSDIGITDFYRYLSLIGEERPETVVEASIFSHAVGYSPVLWDTNDQTGQLDGPRDPFDLDGRTKDFLDINVNGADGWPTLREAFAPTGTFRIWGCNADRLERNRLSEANKRSHEQRPPGELFVVRASDSSHGWSVVERTSLERVRAKTIDRLSNEQRVYARAAAAFLGRPVLAPPPGVGASFGRSSGVSTMFCDRSGAYSPVYRYLQREFPTTQSSEGTFDEGYVDFSTVPPLASVGLPVRDPAIYTFAVHAQRDIGTMVTIDYQLILEPTVGMGGFVGAKFRLEEKPGVLGTRSGHFYTLRDGLDTFSYFVWRATPDRLQFEELPNP